MDKQRIGIAGSARVEGATRTSGAPGTAEIVGNSNPAVKKATIIWAVLLGTLFLFHVGGAKLG